MSWGLETSQVDYFMQEIGNNCECDVMADSDKVGSSGIAIIDVRFYETGR